MNPPEDQIPPDEQIPNVTFADQIPPEEQIPNVIFAVYWGKARNRIEEHILAVPAKIIVHGLFGEKLEFTPLFNVMEDKLIDPKETDETNPERVKFDPSFDDDEEMKYKLMREMPNTEDTSKREEGLVGHLEYGQYLQKYECEKHSKELGMTQKAYFEFITRLFESVEYIINSALIYSSGPSYGFVGIRHFKVKQFLSRLASSELYPVIIAEKANISPFGKPSGSYQVLSEIRLIMDPAYCFIVPQYHEGQAQGKYNPKRDIYLM